jgi:hypothetical protein
MFCLYPNLFTCGRYLWSRSDREIGISRKDLGKDKGFMLASATAGFGNELLNHA